MFVTESRKLQELKSDGRVTRLEIEQLVSRRRQLESETASLQERLKGESVRLEAEEAEWRRREAAADRRLKEAERAVKEAKEKALSLQGEQAALTQAVDDLKRQQATY